jgi:hypothetical protein
VLVTAVDQERERLERAAETLVDADRALVQTREAGSPELRRALGLAQRRIRDALVACAQEEDRRR